MAGSEPFQTLSPLSGKSYRYTNLFLTLFVPFRSTYLIECTNRPVDGIFKKEISSAARARIIFFDIPNKYPKNKKFSITVSVS